MLDEDNKNFFGVVLILYWICLWGKVCLRNFEVDVCCRELIKYSYKRAVMAR